jgi:glycosyltransferase involved in cell wall biosynthesis
MMPTISVVIPAYNAENTILETSASVQQQIFSDFEWIVINDGSTDRTLELLQSVKDERLRIFSYENGGVAVARNCGFSHGTGKFLAFLRPSILLSPGIHKMIINFLLMRTISPRLTNHLLNSITRLRPNPLPQG